MFFAENANRNKDFTIYRSLLNSYKNQTHPQTEQLFLKVMKQASDLSKNSIDIFAVDSDVYYLVKFLAKECKEELSRMNVQSLTTENISLLEACLNKQAPVMA
jgi:hypothetical protein